MKPMAIEQVMSDQDSEDEVDDDIADFEDRRVCPAICHLNSACFLVEILLTVIELALLCYQINVELVEKNYEV